MGKATQDGAARLLIRAQVPGKRGAPVWQRLRALVSGADGHGRSEALRLHIDDLHGRCLLMLDDAGPMVDVPLPAGTYHVFAGVAAQERCYTMTLEPGRPFELVLPFAARQAGAAWPAGADPHAALHNTPLQGRQAALTGRGSDR